MLYGLHDIGRNVLGLSSRSFKLRPGEFWAVNQVSFSLEQGETLGIIGPNGSGKSTILKMLNGIYWPDKGKITIKGRVGALIEVGAGFHSLLTGRENIFINAAILGMNKNEIKNKFNDIVDFAAIGDFLDTPIKYYSSGMFVRLGFAIAVHCHPDILLVDEILAVGDEGFQHKCFDKIGELKQSKTTIIIVSHNMHLISTLSERILLLNKGHSQYFTEPEQGIRAYNQIFLEPGEIGIEKICSGNESIQFLDIKIASNKLNPGSSFSIKLTYKAKIDFPDINIDTAIWSSGDSRLYFQATNQAFSQRIDLHQGSGSIEVAIEDIPLCNTLSKIILAIWSQKRKELLFWWRIPVEFNSRDHSNGRNFLNVKYKIHK